MFFNFSKETNHKLIIIRI